MYRIVCLALCLLQSIIFTHGQSVQSMAPVESCVPGTTTLRCANNFVPVVTSAFYGVAQIPNDCAYKTGDCIADAMNIIVCSSDTVACSIYGVKKKLPQCNDQMSSYLHIEYDCVPISMNNPAQVYDVCQNGSDITSDQGILRSPGYPSQFQTTTAECFRAIQVPSNKTIRLWLSDLNIGSSGIDCAKDHVFVVDSIQTYRHCGVKRLGYPYLCSPTILIQYFVTSKSTFYRGMRMYFDIVDRASNDGCPTTGGTITPVPDSTTTGTTIVPDSSTAAPPYVTLGIASPVRTFQICKGKRF
jgi:CUB domain